MKRGDTGNMRPLSQHLLGGFGNVGEGMSIQLTRDRRRILWLAHESAPKALTAVDVTNPRIRRERPARLTVPQALAVGNWPPASLRP